MALNLDISFFSVVCDLGNCLYMPETDLEDMRLSRLIDDIRSGQLENVRAVLEYNPVEGWCNNITETVLTKALPGEEGGGGPADDWDNYSSERLDGRRAGVDLLVAA